MTDAQPRSARDSALAEIEAFHSPEPGQQRLRAAYADLLRTRPDALERACFPAHLTAGALVISADRERVLLNLHRKAGIWVAFGGHLEPTDASLAGAALREAVEESGIPDLRLLPGPAQLDVHPVDFCHPRGRVDHLDVRYLAVAPPGAEPRVSEESLDVRWWPVEAVPTQEESMLALIERARTA